MLYEYNKLLSNNNALRVDDIDFLYVLIIELS